MYDSKLFQKLMEEQGLRELVIARLCDEQLVQDDPDFWYQFAEECEDQNVN